MALFELQSTCRVMTVFFVVDANRERFLSFFSSFCGLVKTFNNIIIESNPSIKLFNLSDNAISALKKADLVKSIISCRGKVTVDSDF